MLAPIDAGEKILLHLFLFLVIFAILQILPCIVLLCHQIFINLRFLLFLLCHRKPVILVVAHGEFLLLLLELVELVPLQAVSPEDMLVHFVFFSFNGFVFFGLDG